MINDKRDAIAIDVGTNDTLNQVNHEDIAHSIMNIGLDCKNNGLNEVFILVKKTPYLAAIMYRVNAMPRDLSGKNGFSFICNMLLQLIIYKKMVFTCRTEKHIVRNLF